MNRQGSFLAAAQQEKMREREALESGLMFSRDRLVEMMLVWAFVCVLRDCEVVVIMLCTGCAGICLVKDSQFHKLYIAVVIGTVT